MITDNKDKTPYSYTAADLAPYGLLGGYEKGPDMDNIVQSFLNVSDILQTIKRTLQGYSFNEEKQEWIKITKQRLNDLGVEVVMSLINFRLNKVLMMSNFNENEIQKQMYYFAKSLRVLLRSRYKKFEIDVPDLWPLTQAIVDITHGALHHALDGGSRDALTKIQKVSTIQTEDRKAREKKSILPFSIPGVNR